KTPSYSSSRMVMGAGWFATGTSLISVPKPRPVMRRPRLQLCGDRKRYASLFRRSCISQERPAGQLLSAFGQRDRIARSEHGGDPLGAVRSRALDACAPAYVSGTAAFE